MNAFDQLFDEAFVTAMLKHQEAAMNEPLSCGQCKKQFLDDEPVWRRRIWIGYGLQRQRTGIEPVCAGCANKGEPYYYRTGKPCEHCARLVYNPADRIRRKHVWCCGRCEWTGKMAAARAERKLESRICVECGEMFAPDRKDAAYCGGACRQKAYRQRVTVRASRTMM